MQLVLESPFYIYSSGLDQRSEATGLQRAGALIKEPLNSHKQINDIILTGITDQLEEATY